jgi:hypothetical protein
MPFLPKTNAPVFFTMGQAHLKEIEETLQSAQSFILGETSGNTTPEEVRSQALQKISDALSNHVPSVRSRLA